MTEYRYNHLSIVPITQVSRADFKGYPCPWFVIVDDDRRVLADGRSQEAAERDLPNARHAGTPSLLAQRKLRRDRAARRRRRSA